MAVKSVGPDSAQLTRSTTCCGLMPSDPQHEPAGKERMALRTSLSVAWYWGGEEWASFIIFRSVGDGGCISESFLRAAGLSATMLSLEQIILTAALTFSSLIFAEILEAREEEELT